MVIIDSTPYMRAMKRRKAYVNPGGKASYVSVQADSRRETRALLKHNIRVLRLAATAPFERPVEDRQASFDFRSSPAQQDTDDESHVRCKALKGIATRSLGSIHRYVRMLQQRLRVQPIFRVTTDTDTRRYRKMHTGHFNCFR